MKQFIIFFCMVFTAVAAFAQQAHITGLVHDPASKPMSYATVTLRDSSAKLIAAGVTNEKGTFLLDGIPAGNFILTAGFTGFRPFTKSLQINGHTNVQLGTILLVPDPTELTGVTVTADRPSISLKPDRKIFEPGKDILSQAGAVTDLLNLVPSVAVSAGGGISLRGNANVLVLINGRRTGLTQGNALEQIPADQVERVEVITNPSSRYDAGGSAGIINIILKKNKKAGINGQLRLVGGTPNETRVTPSLSYASAKLNVFSTAGIRLSDYNGLYTTTQATHLSSNPVYLDQQQDEKRHDDARLLYAGADYKVNERQTLTAAFLKNATHDHDKSVLNYLYSGAAGSKDSSLSRAAESGEKRSYNQVEFNYTHTFVNPVKKWTVDMQYDFWNSDKDWALHTKKDYPVPADAAAVRTGSAGSSKDMMIQSDLVLPADSNSTFELGVKIESRRVVSDFIAEQQNGTDWHIIDEIDNHLLYKELIGSAYVQYGSRYGKLGYRLGLRNELTNIRTEDRMGTYNTQKNYYGLFPSLNLHYQLKQAVALQASYSRRINRPSLQLIYPFNELTDLNSRYVGNPELNPSYANVYELAFLKTSGKLSFNPSVYYQSNNGVIKDYTFQNNAGLFITTPVNISHEKRLGIELSALYNPAKWLQVNAEMNAYNFKQSGFYKTQNFDYSGNTITARAGTQVKLPGKTSFQLTYNFRGANATAQTRTAAVHAIDLGAGKVFLKSKATLLFDVNNLFALRKFTNTTTGSDYVITQTNIPNAARYRLTFIYRLNLKENQAVRQAKGSNRN